jgi:hypothetical protein
LALLFHVHFCYAKNIACTTTMLLLVVILMLPLLNLTKTGQNSCSAKITWILVAGILQQHCCIDALEVVTANGVAVLLAAAA